MELRLLSTADERRDFARNLLEARLSKGAGFSETRRSVVGEAHLAFASLHALYDDQGAEPNSMIAGFALHDLGTFPQSYPKPDLTGYPPESVIECGELWAKAAGSAQVVRQAAWILAGLLEVQAVLIYPIFKPWNLSRAYTLHFDRAGEPIEWPYIAALDGRRMYVQAMVSSGGKLANMITEANRPGFTANEDFSRITFNTEFGFSTRRRARENRNRAADRVTSAVLEAG